MDYKQTLDYLYNQLPMFTRVGSAAIKKGLDNTLALCEVLDNPHQKFKSIHVGGTNGKGSTSHMLAAILQTAGYKTGLYTSPHLRDFRERIRVNGRMISEQDVVDFVAQHQPDFERIEPSFFEMTVGLAFDHFAKQKVDVAVIEVGLGGRLDSTNVITPLLSVITNIGWDHMNLLGDTLPLIAGEKAGIIKPGVPVVIGEYQSEVAEVFEQKARDQGSDLVFASDMWGVEEHRKGELLSVTVVPERGGGDGTVHYQLDLTGTYQLKNLKTVLTAVAELRQQGFTITDAHVTDALKQVQKLTGLAGRWQTLSTHPLTICDTGHNPEGITEVLRNIAKVSYKQLHFVIGVVNDKDISKILAMLPKEAIYYFCKPDIPRGLEAETLQEKATLAGLKGEVYPSVKAALQAAQTAASVDDLVFVGGSTFVVAEVV
ncbi:bifunctional folylpolyglutamate synthase/dihydrofolate synthase [Mucilaginibacter sp. RS28]|uniref:Dihydrofolate synthase/folylpolyglutamate synthase n=1 Tax=Mucilaginibacter straminoryzae TaxID=2932774 RepID=A0A9X2BDG0_9SPHI|nr:folylpolyglutamate synthase/dihydrofolate synthase family protein [Mucilaginibacter straminoryzae]MCJ8210288.1 bifunctional folylpolyglutamate synthase/dihydrofolate synthase [Mucilaginibacter straminoryzae]